jgi:hypothetical protein
MATTTPLNGWPVPTSTDYVKDGATAIESLGDAIDASVGSGLLAWQSFAPTLGAGWANGNGVWFTGSYCKLGKIVFVRASFSIGSTTTKGTGLNLNLPVTASANAVGTQSGPLTPVTAGGVNTHLLYGQLAGTGQFAFFAVNAAGTYLTRTGVTSAIPATWQTGDVINFNFSYEAA